MTNAIKRAWAYEAGLKLRGNLLSAGKFCKVDLGEGVPKNVAQIYLAQGHFA